MLDKSFTASDHFFCSMSTFIAVATANSEQQANGQLVQNTLSTPEQPAISCFRSQQDARQQQQQFRQTSATEQSHKQPSAAEQNKGEVVIGPAVEALLSLTENSRMDSDTAAATFNDGQTVPSLLEVSLVFVGCRQLQVAVA